MHSLIHVADDCIAHNSHLDAISCFPFENRLGQLVRLVKISNSNHYLAQLRNRLTEINNLAPKTSPNNENGNLASVKLHSYRETLFMLRPGTVVKITNITDQFVVGRKFKLARERDMSFSNLYKVSNVGSSDLNIYLADGLGAERQWSKSEFSEAVKCIAFHLELCNCTHNKWSRSKLFSSLIASI